MNEAVRTPETAELFRPLPFLQLVDRAVKVSRKHFRRVFLPVALPVAITATLWIASYMSLLAPMLSNPEEVANPESIFSGVGCAAVILLFLLFMVVRTLSYNVLTVAVVDALTGRTPRMGECWSYILRPGVLATLLIALFLLVGAGAAFLVPLLVVYPLLAWVVPVMRAEGSRGLEALGRSGQLALHYPRPHRLRSALFKILAVALISFVVGYAANITVTLPFQIFQLPLQLRPLTTDDPDAILSSLRMSLWLTLPATFLGYLAEAAVKIYARFALVMLYFDTRGRAEGRDLEEAVERLRRKFEPAPAHEGETPA